MAMRPISVRGKPVVLQLLLLCLAIQVDYAFGLNAGQHLAELYYSTPA